MLWNTPGWPGWGQGDDTPTKGLVGGHNVFAQPTNEAGVGSQYPAFFIFFVPAACMWVSPVSPHALSRAVAGLMGNRSNKLCVDVMNYLNFLDRSFEKGESDKRGINIAWRRPWSVVCSLGCILLLRHTGHTSRLGVASLRASAVTGKY